MLDDFVPVLNPRSEVELAFAIAALDSERILHFVHNGHFGGLMIRRAAREACEDPGVTNRTRTDGQRRRLELEGRGGVQRLLASPS